MSAPNPRSFLGACLVRLGYSHDTAEELVQKALDRHARELAEKIRSEAGELDGWPETQHAMNKAADLIDPEVAK